MTRAKKRPGAKFVLIAVVLSLGIAAIYYSVTTKKKSSAVAQAGPAKSTPTPDTTPDSVPQPIPPANSDQPAQVRAFRPADATGSANDNKTPLPPSTVPPVPSSYTGAYGSQYGAANDSNPPPSPGSLVDSMTASGAVPETPTAERVAASLSDDSTPPQPAAGFVADNSIPSPPIGSDSRSTNAAGSSPTMAVGMAGAASDSTYPPLPPMRQLGNASPSGTLPAISAAAAPGSVSDSFGNAAEYRSSATFVPNAPGSAAIPMGTGSAVPPTSQPPEPMPTPAAAAGHDIGGTALGVMAGTQQSIAPNKSTESEGDTSTMPVSVPASGSPQTLPLGTNEPIATSPNGLDATIPNSQVSPTPPAVGIPSSAAPSSMPTSSNTPDAFGGISTPGVPSAPLATTSTLPSTPNSPVAIGSASTRAMASQSGGEGPLDVPGDHRFEGQQTPTLAIEKSGPEEVQVDRKAVFQIQVHNVGNVPAHDVMVLDRVPRGTEFVHASSDITPTADGLLVWQLGTISPGQTVSVSLEVLPKMEGEIGSVAQLTFRAQASVRSVCTRPQLSVQQSAPEKVLIGQTATVHITVSNTGSGAAANVVLEEDVPDGLTHAAGRELEHAIGTLAPGASIELALALNAVKPGTYQNNLVVRGEGNLVAQDQKPIEVTAPQLKLAAQGPSHRFLDRQATYTIQIANPGTASAQSLELVSYLPKGMKYVTSDQQGQYDPQTHAVYWSLEELPAGAQGEIHVSVLPLEAGELKLRVEGKAKLGLSQSVEHTVRVEGTAELAFTVKDTADPIELDSDTTYEVQVQNRGSKADANVQLVAQLPPGLEPTSGSGPTQATVQDQLISFAPVAGLAPDEQVVFTIHARGKEVGTHVIRVQLLSAELPVPVTKEEGTRVYSDR